MECPHCGASMKDEQVFCEKCGRERQLVPVFDAQIDATLQSTLSGIADDLANTKEIKPALVQAQIEKQKEKKELNTETHKKGKTGSIIWFLSGIFAVVILIIAIAFLVARYNNHSYEYQMQRAEEMYSAGDYEQMLVYAKKAMELAENSSDAKMMMARAYEGLGSQDMKRQMLIALLEADPAYSSAYDMLIAMLDAQQEYVQIGQLLNKCPQQSVLDKYAEYLTDAPQFSEEGGTYDGVSSVSIKLLAPGTGIIYYTLNGRDPIEYGREYMTPIILDAGEYEVRAVYRNIYGVYSEIVSQAYTIEGNHTDQPLVSLESGVYDSPQYISILNEDVLDTIYYTTDGTEPDTNSMLYSKPIPLPLGDSKFVFAAYEDDLQVSECTYTEYSLHLDTGVTGEQAVNMLVQSQIKAGVLASHDGVLPDMEGKKSYEVYSVISQNDILYYLLAELYTPPEGTAQRTGNLFAVSTSTGESYVAKQNELGIFDLHKIE